MSDDRQDSGIAHGSSFDASSGSAAAVAVAELLDGASVGSFEHQLARWSSVTFLNSAFGRSGKTSFPKNEKTKS